MNNPKLSSYQLSQTPIPVLHFQQPAASKMSPPPQHQQQPQQRNQQPSFQTPLPSLPPTILVSFPRPSILLITLNRPRSLNCLSSSQHHVLHALYTFLDAEPSLSCAILTGAGRAFCAGADLKEWHTSTTTTTTTTTTNSQQQRPPPGFGGLSRRLGKKPVIAAVNGLCFGGGFEMIVNADIVIASSQATFALPEVKRGVVALAGALTRLVRTVGKQRAMEMVITGRTLSAREAERWGLVNRVVWGGGGGEGEKGEKGKKREGERTEVVQEAIRVAEMIAGNSPDSVIVSREGIKLGWEGVGVEEGTRIIEREWYPRMDRGENMKEGLRAFVEKRRPNWVPSKL